MVNIGQHCLTLAPRRKVMEPASTRMSRSTSKCALAAWVKAINMTNFKVRSLKERAGEGPMARSWRETGETFQVSAYRGDDGLRLKIPQSNLLTRGLLPALQPSTTIPREERAPLAELTQSYPTLLWKVSDMKLTMWVTEGARGLMCQKRQNCSHRVICVRYCRLVPGLRNAAASQSLPDRRQAINLEWRMMERGG